MRQRKGYNGFKRISGTKIHVAVKQNRLPVSIVTSPANIHDSTKFVDVMESISDFVNDSMIDEIITVYADKRYDAKYIRNYLRCNGIGCCIPYKSNSKFIIPKKYTKQIQQNKVCSAERFFAWLKNGFHKTRIRYERNAENYLGLINIASFLMYCRVLR